METKMIFANAKYTEKYLLKNMSLYFKKHVGFDIEPENIKYLKVPIDDIVTFIVILKDDIRRISKSHGGSGVLRQKQWSIFVFNFINSNEYVKYFGKNANKKQINDPYKYINWDSFTYEEKHNKYTGKNPEKLFRSASINYLLHHFIYSKLRKQFRYLFLNSYVYSVIDIIEEENKRANFSTYYYNSSHIFRAVSNPNKVISQKVDINKTSSLVIDVALELENIETNYGDMSSLISAYKGELPLNSVTNNNFENINIDIENKENYIITEGTARTGKTIIAMRLLGKYHESRLIIMNELFYKSLIEIFKVENVQFPIDRIICHTNFTKMVEWTENSKILIIDEAQRLNNAQILKTLNNKENVNIFLGDNLQAINRKSDQGIDTIEKSLLNNNIDFKKYYFDYSIGIASNVLYSIKYLIYNNIYFNNQNIYNYEINIFDDEMKFISKYKNDNTYRKHMATIYMGDFDYNETITSFVRWHVDLLRGYPYFLDKDIKEKVMITTYELISRELESIYIYIPESVTADDKGFHYKNKNYDEYLLNQLYVLFTRAKGEINVYCKSKSAYEYINCRNTKIIKNDRIISTLSEEEKERSIALENKITERGITRLIHFTPKENLDSILKHGIMSIATMKKKSINYLHNDNGRYDNVQDGISLSIQNPNHFLLNKFKNNYNGREYVCLILDPALLYEITDESGEKLAPRIYCNYNAASLSSEKSIYDFDIMFKNSFIAGSWNNLRTFKRNEKDDNETTAEQAEILFRSTIDPKYILEIKEV